MVLTSVTDLSMDFEEVRAAMLGRPDEWLEDIASATGMESDRLLVDVGLEVRGRQLSGRARIDVGEPITTDRVASVPLRHQAAEHGRLFPALEGSLAGCGPHTPGADRPERPFGFLGKAVDRALLNRVAEAVGQRFLEAVAQRVGGVAGFERSASGQALRGGPTRSLTHAASAVALAGVGPSGLGGDWSAGHAGLMQMRTIVNPDVARAEVAEPLATLAQRMREHGISSLPV